MRTLADLGREIAARREARGLRQSDLAESAGVPRENLSRLERGRVAEFGARKLLQILSALDLELRFVEAGHTGSLDELRKERGGA